MDDNGIAVWFPPGAAGTAHDGLETLVELDDEGSIRLIRAAVTERGADGALAVSEQAHSTWGRGATIGGVIGGDQPDAVGGAMARLGGEVTRRSVFDIERELAERRDGDGADGRT
jgi:hypothetical protein